jgi:hypothetical protein
MVQNGGFKLAIAAVISGFLGFTLPAASVFQAPAVASIDASGTPGDQLMVCVAWETTEIKYSKHWETCPSKHQNILLGVQGPKGEPGPQGETGARGPRGFSGSSGSSTNMWDSLPTCYSKLQTALSAGLYMAKKSDRTFFEGATGCTVEEISNTSQAGIAAAAGMPYISSFAFSSWTPQSGGEGGDSPFITAESQIAIFNLTVENGDALSALDPDYKLCNSPTSSYTSVFGAPLTHLGGKNYTVRARVHAENYSLTTRLTLGFWLWNSGECMPLIVNSGDPEILVHFDPALATPTVFDQKLASWGW